MIDCGPGKDKAFVDLRGLDPMPKHCERVKAIEGRVPARRRTPRLNGSASPSRLETTTR